jgi:hypothetical protein
LPFNEVNLLAHRDRPRPLLRASRPDAPPELETIYQRMVAPLPADWFGSVAEVVDALDACEHLDRLNPADSSVIQDNASTDSGCDIAPTTCFSASSLALAVVSVLLVEHSRLQTRVISGQLAELGIATIRTAVSSIS